MSLEPIAFGQRLKLLRNRRGLTQTTFAGLAGRSTSWVKQIEAGQLGVPKLPMLLRIAEVLRVRNLGDLTGDQSLSCDLFAGPGHARLPAVREAMDAMLVPTSQPAPPLGHLRARLTQAWQARHAAPNHREVVGALLPHLIRDARLAVQQTDRASDRRAAQACVAEVYALAQFFLAYQPDNHLLWRAADRGMTAAQEADDPRALGVAAWLVGQAHRDAGRIDTSEAVIQEAISYLEPLLPDADNSVMSIAGSLYAEAGHTAARCGQQAVAWRYWDLARAIAHRLPADWYDPVTSFSQAIIGAHAVTTAAELRAGGEGIRQVDATDDTAIPSRPRRARHQIEEARIYQITGQPEAALAAIAHAYTSAPETVRYNGYARGIVLEQSESKSPRRRQRASALAEKIGLVSA